MFNTYSDAQARFNREAGLTRCPQPDTDAKFAYPKYLKPTRRLLRKLGEMVSARVMETTL